MIALLFFDPVYYLIGIPVQLGSSFLGCVISKRVFSLPRRPHFLLGAVFSCVSALIYLFLLSVFGINSPFFDEWVSVKASILDYVIRFFIMVVFAFIFNCTFTAGKRPLGEISDKSRVFTALIISAATSLFSCITVYIMLLI